MNLVVPQQVKDRFSEVQAEVRGQIVALQHKAGANYAEARQRLDALPSELQHFWSGLRARLQLLLDFAPKGELLALEGKLEALSLEVERLGGERASLRSELLALLEDRLAATPAVVEAAGPVETASVEVEAETAAPSTAPGKESRPNGSKPKNGNRRR